MAVTGSPSYRRNAISSDGVDPILLVTIDIPGYSPIHLCDSNEPITSNNTTYEPRYMRLAMPIHTTDKAPQTTLTLANIEQDIITLLDATNGGEGTKVHLSQILPDSPDFHEFPMSLDLIGVSVTDDAVQLTLTIKQLVNVPTIRYIYDNFTTPGIF